jgi:hypothetical protein
MHKGTAVRVSHQDELLHILCVDEVFELIDMGPKTDVSVKIGGVAAQPQEARRYNPMAEPAK